jgi:hypothetical protein
MILQYWASHTSGYWSDLITTSIHAIGSPEYEYDYWTGVGLTNPGMDNDPASDPDPYLPGYPPNPADPGWIPHGDNSIADFLHTSRSDEELADGDTRRSNIASGVMGYANWDDPNTNTVNEGYYAASWLANVEQYDPPGDPAPFSWDAYKAEIDENRPVLISVRNFHELDPHTGSPVIYGHSVVGYGYKDDMFQVRYFIGPSPGGQVEEDDPAQWETATVGGMAVMDTWLAGASGSSWWDGTSAIPPKFTDINGVPVDPPPTTPDAVEWWPFIDLTATNGWLYDNAYAESWLVRGAVYFHPLAKRPLAQN